MAAEIIAGVVAGEIAAVHRSAPEGQTDIRPVAAVVLLLIGVGLLAIPIGIVRGTRRRRRWIEATILQAVLGLIGLVGLVYSREGGAALSAMGWLVVSGIVLALLISGRGYVEQVMEDATE